jgi:hypothetical protein
MKLARRILIFGFCTVGVYVLAQFSTDKSPPNRISESDLHKIASRLMIGMEEKVAIQLLTANG